jgi:hypothetical protein
MPSVAQGRTAWLLATALLVMAPAAAAAEPRFEAGAFGGWRVGGEFRADADTPEERDVDLDEGGSWGVGFGLYRDPDSFYELLYSRQATGLDPGDFGPGAPDITVEYYHFGGTVLLGDDPRLRSFVSLTAGAARFRADGYGSETELSISLGTGLRVPVTERFMIDLGVRGYLSFIDQDTRLFCASIDGQGGCLLESSGSSVLQVEAGAGFRYRF